MRGTSLLWLLLPVVACNWVGSAAAAREPAGLASGVYAVAAPASPIPVVPASRREQDGGCRFTHRGDQSRSPKLAVTELHRVDDEGARYTLAWTAPRFTSHLDGYEYRAYAVARGAVWVDTGGLSPAVELPAPRSGRAQAFEVVARYRYPLRDGHAYYWYGPVATTQHAASGSVACGSSFGHPDTTLAFE